MSKLNKTVKNSYQNDSHKNFMNGNSWDLSDNFKKLLIIGASSFFGEPKYYNESGNVDKIYVSTGDTLDIYEYIVKSLGNAILRPATYDEDSFSWQEKTENIIDKCLDENVEKTLQIAVELRNDYMIRSIPQVILVRAAVHKNSKGTGLIGKYINKICIRGDEPAAGLSYFFVLHFHSLIC